MSDQIGDVLGNNVNVNKAVRTNVNVTNVRTTAGKLLERLGDTQSERFYLKVAHNLPEHVIWKELETALTKRKPAAYFSTTCASIMRDMGVQ